MLYLFYFYLFEHGKFPSDVSCLKHFPRLFQIFEIIDIEEIRDRSDVFLGIQHEFFKRVRACVRDRVQIFNTCFEIPSENRACSVV